MPNTLVHFGVQGLAWRGLGGHPADLKWVFLGAVIPDVPWIIRRTLSSLLPGLDPYDLMVYATVQASLLYCVLAAVGLSLFGTRPRAVFAVLVSNSLVHLLLDASELKWGNGVHFIAPYSWQLNNWGLVWPESVVVAGATLVGLVVCLWALKNAGNGKLTPRLPRLATSLPGVLVAGIYLLGPLGLMNGPYEADNHSVKTLSDVTTRSGKAVTFDRRPLDIVADRLTIRTYANEQIDVVASPSTVPGVVSMRARFVDQHTVVVSEIYYHKAWFRDGASYVGLALFVALWFAGVWRSRFAQPDDTTV